MKTSFTLKPMLFLLGLSAAAPALAAPTFTDLGVFFSSFGASAINNLGQVAGTSGATTDLATVWNSSTSLSTPVGSTSVGFGINASSQVVGQVTDAVGNGNATIWNAGSPSTLAIVNPNGINGVANAINNNGFVVGQYTDSGTLLTQATHWDTTTSTNVDLNNLGAGSSAATAINNNNNIVGYTTDTTAVTHAVLWSAVGVVTPTDLGVGHAWGINDQNLKGMSSIVGDSNGSAALWTWDSVSGTALFKDLGAGVAGSWAAGVNSSGFVVGQTTFKDLAGTGVSGAALWLSDGTAIDLNKWAGAGWHFDTAYSINDSGQIVGTGSYLNEARSFQLDGVLAAVPENDTSTMLISGLGLLGFMVRRRMSAQA